ncbi:MAG: hypothetical protein V1848_02325 [Candidatus Magasanikbacteria bacterium]
MESQQFQPNKDTKPNSFKLYTGKAPLPLQIVGGLMCLSGLGIIVTGILQLLFFGIVFGIVVGIIFIIFGILNIKYGSGIFKMHKKAYTGAMVLNMLSLIYTIFFEVSNQLAGGNFADAKTLISLGGIVLFIVILYSYREKFVS